MVIMNCKLRYMVIAIVLWATLPLYLFRVATTENADQKSKLYGSFYDDDEEFASAYDRLQDSYSEKTKKSRGPKRKLKDLDQPHKPSLLLLKFPPEFGKEMVVNLIEKHFGHLVDKSTLKNIASGDVDAIPSTWSFLRNLDVKGAVFGVLAKHFLRDYKAVAEHPPIKGITQDECETECKMKEDKLDEFMSTKISEFLDRGITDKDIRIKVVPKSKKYFRYQSKTDGKQSNCICKEVKKNIYVSPDLKKLIDKTFFQTDDGVTVEDRIEELILQDPIFENGIDTGSFSWKSNIAGFASKTMQSIGLASESKRVRRVTEEGFGKNRAFELIEYLLLHAFISFMLISFCPCLWPFHLFIAVYGFFKWL